jgi:DMSO/TMAO reductase YedYZ molybdopterin-dependent catalytic subunit
MLRRRTLLAQAAGTLIAGGLWPRLTRAQADALAVPGEVPGKGALIRRAFRPPNYETPLGGLVPAFTPNELFFVRYHLAVIPSIDPARWRLQVRGASAAHELSLSLRNLREDFEPVTLAAVNQCSGNRRGLFSPRVPGVQWGNGAMGNARWTGVRLRDVLARAGVVAGALETWFAGADSAVLPATPNFQKSLPMDRALDESTLIAYQMNGAPLPQLNGAPARLIVPGWTGTYWMKHLTEIRIEPVPLTNFWMKAAYRLPAGAFPGARFPSQDNAESVPITEILVNSLITSHVSGARLRRGQRAHVAGKAWDNGAGIERVEVSTDGRRSWRQAALGTDLGRFAWREFSLALPAEQRGALEIAVRASSRNGSRQPEKLTFNPSGYHDNIVQSVTLEVV